MENKNILIIVPMTEEHEKRILKAAKGSTITYCAPKSVTEEMVKNAEIIIGNVPPEFINKSEKLEFLQLNSSGADAYLKEGVLNKKTLLANAAGAYNKAVSEHMFSMLLCLIKKLHLYRDNQRNSIWQDEGKVSSLSDATVLIVGLGDIGLSFARMCKAFGARVIGMKRTVDKKYDCVDELYKIDDLEKVLPLADVVISILPSTPQTRGMFCKKTFTLMKDKAIYLNGGRGDAVIMADLDEAVKTGKLSCAGMDVTDPEPLPETSPLWLNKNIFITPHVAGHYHLPETLEKIRNIAITNLELYMSGKEITNNVKH